MSEKETLKSKIHAVLEEDSNIPPSEIITKFPRESKAYIYKVVNEWRKAHVNHESKPRKIDEQKALVESTRPTTPYQRFIELLADKAEADKALAAFDGERERVLADLEARRQRLQREAAQAKAAVDAHVDMHHAELNAALHVQETIIKKAVQRTVAEQEAATRAAEWRRMELEATREH